MLGRVGLEKLLSCGLEQVWAGFSPISRANYNCDWRLGTFMEMDWHPCVVVPMSLVFLGNYNLINVIAFSLQGIRDATLDLLHILVAVHAEVSIN